VLPGEIPKVARCERKRNASAGIYELTISIMAFFKPRMGRLAPPCFRLRKD